MLHRRLDLQHLVDTRHGPGINIADMAPLDEYSHHRSAGLSRYALEVHQGWFSERGIAPGDKVVFELPASVEVK